jgi:hypothetical protein
MALVTVIYQVGRWHTFAESHTSLNRHILGGGTGVKKSSWAAEIFETSSIFKRSVVCARWLRGLLVSPHHIDRIVTSINTGNERERCGGSSKEVEVQHDGSLS